MSTPIKPSSNDSWSFLPSSTEGKMIAFGAIATLVGVLAYNVFTSQKEVNRENPRPRYDEDRYDEDKEIESPRIPAEAPKVTHHEPAAPVVRFTPAPAATPAPVPVQAYTPPPSVVVDLRSRVEYIPPTLPQLYKESIGYEQDKGHQNGMTKSKLLTLSLIKNRLDKQGMVSGQAVDNGDCFYHAFAQSLNEQRRKTGEKPVTVVELRKQVAKHLNDESIAQHWSKDVTPVWGNPDREGKALCQIYKVNLCFYAAEIHDLTGDKANSIMAGGKEAREKLLADSERCMFGRSPNDSTVISPAYPTIHMVGARKHFMPVFKKEGILPT